MGLFVAGRCVRVCLGHRPRVFAGLLLVWRVVTTILSFQFLSRAVRTVLIGIAYAVWGGVGAVGAHGPGRHRLRRAQELYEDTEQPVRRYWDF